MVLTDRQRADLHAGIYEYLLSQKEEAFHVAAKALLEADPESCGAANVDPSKIPILEKKWTAIPRLQKKVLELERVAAQSAKIHAHRAGTAETANGGTRRMLPRQPPTHTLQGHTSGVTCVRVHPVYTMVASASEDGTIKLWDHESGDFMRTLKGHTNTVNGLAFTPTGSHLASCSTDLSIKLWELKDDFQCLRTLRGHDHTISAVIFLPLPSIVNTSSSSSTTGMDASTAGCQHLISASRDETVKLWDVETGFCDHTFSDHTDWVRCLAVRESDGGLWASAGNDTTIRVYDNGKNMIQELRGHEQVVEAVAFIKEEALKAGTRETKHVQMIRDYLASASRDRTVRLWRVSEGSCIGVFKAHDNWVRSVVIHPSGNYIISSSDDKTIRVFDIKANRCLRTLEDAHKHFIGSVDMHHTLPVLVSGSVDQTIRCWQLD